MLIMDPSASALKRQLNDPIVVLFHDGEASREEYTNALEVMKDRDPPLSDTIARDAF